MTVKTKCASTTAGRQIRRFSLSWAVACFFAGLMAAVIFYWARGDRPQESDTSGIGNDAPYYAEIKEIIKPLRYSGFASIMLPDVKITVNFLARTWRLHNIHRFDKDGRVVLAEGRYGLCGDLAAYTYDKIRPLFGGEYQIDFVRVAESGYFLDPRASHIALLITRRSFLGQAVVYLLDPSFRRYGREDNFDEYLFFDKMRALPFVENKDSDEVFGVGAITPILIRKEYIIGLIIDEQNGRFDKDNFIMAITATRRFKYTGRSILAIRRIDGRTEITEDGYLGNKLLGREIYDSLCERIKQLYSGI